MIIVIIAIAVVITLAYCTHLSSADMPPKEKPTKVPSTYKQDIDWTLAVKGYPVVNDVDIAYTQREAAQAKIEAQFDKF